MKNNILIIGCGGHARSIIEIIESTNKWRICGLIGLECEYGKKVLGYPVIGVEKDLRMLRKEYRFCFNAIGQIKDTKKRFEKVNLLKELNFSLPNLIANSYCLPCCITLQP